MIVDLSFIIKVIVHISFSAGSLKVTLPRDTFKHFKLCFDTLMFKLPK